MKIGILANTDKNAADVIGITKAAVGKGHSVIIFCMDKGTQLLSNKEFLGLSELGGVKMGFCDHSAQHEKVSKVGIPPKVVCGSQFDNANMMHDADRVISL